MSSATRSNTKENTLTTSNGSSPRRRAGLSGMVLAELRELAGQLGITGIAGMRKGDLIAAIKERQGGTSGRGNAATPPKAAEQSTAAPAAEKPASRPTRRRVQQEPDPAQQQLAVLDRQADKPAEAPAETAQPAADRSAGGEDEGTRRGNRRRRASSRPAGSPDGAERTAGDGQAERGQGERGRAERGDERTGERQQSERADRSGERTGDRSADRSGDRAGDRSSDRSSDRSGDRSGDRQQGGRPSADDDDDRNRRGRRFRDRRRRGGRGEGGSSSGGGSDTEIREDDVLLPVAGILDVLENYAFVRTSGYLAGPNDVYVSLSLVRKYGLRRGDGIKGVVRQPREGEQQRQKFNPLVRVDSINGMEPEAAKNRPEFHKLTPLYPNERLRLETEPHILTTRVIDLVMPVGKGQRALIVSPPKAGKTSVLQAIANAITTNNPECHLMVVLADERPEEVTDMQRSVKGEVIASTFDRPPSDHTTVAELSIERAKRLVEMGYDVVVLLDSITRLGRAYNLAAPASGRILSGGVDSTALYPPKRFLGAARNIEGGGSLTIFATALVETGSTMDTVIFEEFKGTGNAELKLDRKIADKRTFPAVDVDQSSTRKEELLLSPDELAVTHKLRRVLHALDSQQAIELLLDRLRKTRTNIEFLMQIAKSAPGNDD
ncbi:transcription termination factor Rho [Goodfellowiella coeruleoviolacea]|uniref:Transcription termination factor Rho n=1 Tax=Goodfellowiella coeruleoviolacea TaxID=334858 RepID=A0AAE3KHI8_9PSEU|nr:transcription termination factor Rho [Goodfellowiella coeruleoviolacea]MCP2166927.1 transcription termination factor Rho [Goodfellowiella coeruleoviolacea]